VLTLSLASYNSNKQVLLILGMIIDIEMSLIAHYSLWRRYTNTYLV
jgi:hypothetical protein